MERVSYIARTEGRLTVTGVPEGYDVWLAAEAALRLKGLVLFVVPDDLHAAGACAAARFFAPGVPVLSFPAWDCLPYDRVSPRPDIESTRLATLSALARRTKDSGPALVVTTVNAVLQRVPPREAVLGASFAARVGDKVSHEKLALFLAHNGYVRTGTVREPGDFALRGGIVDLWPPGERPLRLDFFGETLDAVRSFDAETQLSSGEVAAIELLPAGEVPLDGDSISRFRSGYVAAFGPAGDDPLYESVSAGRHAQGMEHWLPLFYGKLETLFDFAPRALVMLGHYFDEAKAARLELIADYYETRRQFLKGDGAAKGALKSPPYKPLQPDRLYLTAEEWNQALARFAVRDLSPFQAPESMASVDAGGKLGRDFAPERTQGRVNVFEGAAAH
ncbi:MAG TPA: hypothetical protein VGC27_05800, partial [Rhizomicrobium sp.]